jgi:hypothetical protein
MWRPLTVPAGTTMLKQNPRHPYFDSTLTRWRAKLGAYGLPVLHLPEMAPSLTKH